MSEEELRKVVVEYDRFLREGGSSTGGLLVLSIGGGCEMNKYIKKVVSEIGI